MPNLLFGAMTPRTNSLAKIKSITYSGRKSFTACYDDGQVIRMQFSGFFGWSVTSYVF